MRVLKGGDMEMEIKAEFVREDNGDIKISTHREAFYKAEINEAVEVKTVFAEIKVTADSEVENLKIRVDGSQLNDAEYQKKVLQEVVFHKRIGWLGL
ncbi:MAG: hypothetical protein JWN60_874 [Acidobacteria bacterium]|nr:hypothetical protein [Acidobacteriota bacterium]